MMKRKVIQDSISLLKDEEKLFGFLLDVVKKNETSTTLRVAGGWVRDKLLGRFSDDIDIVLDNMTGAQFAELINKYDLDISKRTQKKSKKEKEIEKQLEKQAEETKERLAVLSQIDTIIESRRLEKRIKASIFAQKRLIAQLEAEKEEPKKQETNKPLNCSRMI